MCVCECVDLAILKIDPVQDAPASLHRISELPLSSSKLRLVAMVTG